MENAVETEHAIGHEPRSDAAVLLEELRERNKAERELAAGVRAAAQERMGTGGSGSERADRALRAVCIEQQLVCWRLESTTAKALEDWAVEDTCKILLCNRVRGEAVDWASQVFARGPNKDMHCKRIFLRENEESCMVAMLAPGVDDNRTGEGRTKQETTTQAKASTRMALGPRTP